MIWRVSTKKIYEFLILKGYITGKNFPFPIKPQFSTLGSFLEIAQSRGWQISFAQKDFLRDILGFKSTVIHEEYNLSPNANVKL